MISNLVAFGLIAATPLTDLTAGVKTVATPGLPGGVAALDARATVFIKGADGNNWRPIAAASTLGSGRVAAFGHDGYLGAGVLTVGDTKQLLNNTFRWVSAKSSPRVGYFNRGHEALLKGLGFEAVWSPSGSFSGVDVLLVDANGPTQGVADFVKRGGGLVTAYTGWGWMQLNPGKSLAKDLPLNQVLWQAGLTFTDSTLSPAKPVASEAESASMNAQSVLNTIAAGKSADEEVVTAAIRAIPSSHPLFQRAAAIASSTTNIVPTAAKPVSGDEDKIRLGITVNRLMHGGSEEGPAVAAAADFPGAVASGAKRATVSVPIPVSSERWASTGTYAAAGDRITVQIPSEWTTKGLQVQVGCHSDTLWHLDKWQRMPDVVVSKAMTSTETTIQSPFGGLVYILVPNLNRAGSSSGSLTVKLGNVVKAGWFVKGQTSVAQWKADLAAGAPWAELQGEHLILSVPAAEAKKVADPEALMKLWDETMLKFSDLDGSPLFNRPERMVADRQISAGYMHSGYPIMTWMDDSVPLSLDPKRLTTEGTWGHWHELGHNRQKSEWTFEGTGEVTNNIFTLYMMEKVAGRGIWSRLDEKTRERARSYQAAGADFEKWKSDPFLALTMYGQLIDAFGWDACKKWFRDYSQGPRPKNDQESRDQFLTRYSRVVGKDLSPFFRRWGVPTTAAAQKSLAALPAWEGPLP